MISLKKTTKLEEFWTLAHKFCPKGVAWLISGGSAANILKTIPETKTPTELWIADERYVDKNHKYSNFSQISSLFTGKVHSFNTDLPIIDAITDYEGNIPANLSFGVLGIGPDGHIASIFPTESGALVKTTTKADFAHTQTHIFDVSDRLTISYQRLNRISNLLFLFYGEKKAPIFESIQTLLKNTESIDNNAKNTPIIQFLQQYKGNATIIYGDF